jgi:hypothetical protein
MLSKGKYYKFYKYSYSKFTNKVKPQWRDEFEIYGNKLFLENSNFKKRIGVKIYETFRNYKIFKVHFIQMKLPGILKFFIGCEVINWSYSYFIGPFLFKNFNQYEKKISDTIINKLLHKTNTTTDYLVNILIYLTLGKTLYILNKNMFLNSIALGFVFSCFSIYLNDKTQSIMEKEFSIEDFQLFPHSPNLIPSVMLSCSILKFLDYFLTDKPKLIRNVIPFNRKYLTMFFSIFLIAKMTKFMSHFSSESIK